MKQMEPLGPHSPRKTSERPYSASFSLIFGSISRPPRYAAILFNPTTVVANVEERLGNPNRERKKLYSFCQNNLSTLSRR